MDDKDFNDLANYKQTLGDEGKPKRMTFYDTYIKKGKNKNSEGEKKEPKSAIWWMIMIFCVVYGIEIVYNALIAAPITP